MRFLYLSRGVGGAARAASQRGCARVYRGPCPGGARDADALEVLALLVGVALVAALVRAPPVLPAALVERHQEVGARIAEGKWDLCRPDGLNVLIVLGLGLRIGVMVSSSHGVASSCVLWG